MPSLLQVALVIIAVSSARGGCPSKNHPLPREQCPSVCGDIYQPLCATSQDGDKTFNNPCQLREAQCKQPQQNYQKSYDGACVRDCGVCTKEYKPVCASGVSGFITFGNGCELDVANCENPKEDYTLYSDGVCPGSEGSSLESPSAENRSDNPSSESGPENASSENGSANLSSENGPGNPSSENSPANPSSESPSSENIPQNSSSESTTPRSSCPEACTAQYQPVCGSSLSSKPTTYGNLCTFQIIQCKNPDLKYQVISDGECPRTTTQACPNICPDYYKPVCASGKSGDTTFGNTCRLAAAQCEHPEEEYVKVSDCACSTRQARKRDCGFCTEDFRPVCAKSGATGETRTFGNSCKVDVGNCLEPGKKYQIISNEACSDQQ